MDSIENIKNERDLFEWSAKMKAKLTRICEIKIKGVLGMELKKKMNGGL